MDEPVKAPGPDDPRGRGFRHRVPVASVHDAIAMHVRRIGTESVTLTDAIDRILAEPVIANVPVPQFARAAMDGFAVISSETQYASAAEPAFFSLIGRSGPGRSFAGKVQPGQAVAIATGAPMPEGADAVVPVEFAVASGERLEVRTYVPAGRHVGQVADDVEPGAEVLRPGRCLRPQDLGLLSALGMARVPVVLRPGVGVLVTGDELLPAGSRPSGCAIPDMNSPMLAALIGRDGGSAKVVGPIADDATRLKRHLIDLIEDPAIHAVFVNGGTSTGPEDHAPGLIRELGTLLAHGVAIRPAGPTGFGMIQGKPVLLLPGNPVSCLCAYDVFGGQIVRQQGGRNTASPYPVVRRRLSAPIVSAVTRVDYVRVRAVNEDEVEPIATSGASNLSSTIAACGFVIVQADQERVEKGTEVDVHLYDRYTAS